MLTSCEKCPGSLCEEHPPAAVLVFDGTALLHRISWPKVGTLRTVCSAFIAAVTCAAQSKVCVVFDSYRSHTTKAPEQKRRKIQQPSCPDYDVRAETPITFSRDALLSNQHNKQNLIDLVSSHLQVEGIRVEHAGNEGDADTKIVQKALKATEHGVV